MDRKLTKAVLDALWVDSDDGNLMRLKKVGLRASGGRGLCAVLSRLMMMMNILKIVIKLFSKIFT